MNMNILFYRYGSICEPDIIQILLQAGHQVAELTEEMTNKQFSDKERISLVSMELKKYTYDFIFIR